MNCPNCQSSNHVKNGLLKGVQRYKCKDCGCSYTRIYAHYQEKEKKRHFAFSMYLEGLGFHSISRLLNVSHVSAINWIKKYGKDLETVRNPRSCQFMELDEMHSYILEIKTIIGFGLVLIKTQETNIDMVVGSRNTKTGLKLWEKIKEQAVIYANLLIQKK